MVNAHVAATRYQWNWIIPGVDAGASGVLIRAVVSPQPNARRPPGQAWRCE